MKKFIFQQQVFKLQFPTEFQDILSLSSQGKGSLKVEGVGPAITIKLNALAHFTLEELHSVYSDSLFFSTESGIILLPKVHERILTLEQVGHMKQLYSLLYPKYNVSIFMSILHLQVYWVKTIILAIVETLCIYRCGQTRSSCLPYIRISYAKGLIYS